MGNLLGKKKEYKLLMAGLDAAGKTTLLYRLKLGETVTTIPTIGFNVETVVNNNVSLTMWDVGLRSKSRPLLRHYYPNSQALIVVIDSDDRERMSEAKYEMDVMLQEDELREVPLVVVCNKQDIVTAMSVPEISESLQLYKVNRPCGVFPTCAITGEGLEEVVNWLTDTLTGQVTPTSPQKGTTEDSQRSGQSHSVSDYFWKGWEAFRGIFLS